MQAENNSEIDKFLGTSRHLLTDLMLTLANNITTAVNRCHAIISLLLLLFFPLFLAVLLFVSTSPPLPKLTPPYPKPLVLFFFPVSFGCFSDLHVHSDEPCLDKSQVGLVWWCERCVVVL